MYRNQLLSKLGTKTTGKGKELIAKTEPKNKSINSIQRLEKLLKRDHCKCMGLTESKPATSQFPWATAKWVCPSQITNIGPLLQPNRCCNKTTHWTWGGDRLGFQNWSHTPLRSSMQRARVVCHASSTKALQAMDWIKCANSYQNSLLLIDDAPCLTSFAPSHW